MKVTNDLCPACGKDSPRDGERFCPHCIAVFDGMFPLGLWRGLSEEKQDEHI